MVFYIVDHGNEVIYDGTLCLSHSVKVLRNFARNGLNNVNLKIAQTTNNIFKKISIETASLQLVVLF